MASPHMDGPLRTWCCGKALAPVYYAPAKTAHAMEMCNISAALVKHMCVAYDVGFIKPDFFTMLNAYWKCAPERLWDATLAWQEMDKLFIIAAKHVTPAEYGPVFTTLALQAREIAHWSKSQLSE